MYVYVNIYRQYIIVTYSCLAIPVEVQLDPDRGGRGD